MFFKRSVVAILVAAAAALALSAVEAKAAPDSSFTTTLYPGWNLVGWVDADTSVERTMRELSGLSSVWAAQPAEDGARDRPTTLKRGSSYWFKIDEERPVQWRRQIAERDGRLRLLKGSQTVVWTGRGDLTLDSATRALDGVLSSAWLWDASRQSFRSWTPGERYLGSLAVPVPATTGPSLSGLAVASTHLRPGQVVGLRLTEATSWRQPTGRLPEVKFLGDVPEQIRNQAMSDVEWVTTYFAREFGLEAEPDLLEIVVPRDPQDLFRGGVSEWPDVTTQTAVPQNPRSELTTILVPMFEWAPYLVDSDTGESVNGRVVLLHEYYHAVQAHLAGSAVHDVPDWLVEAGPTWLMNEHNPQADGSAYDLEVAAQVTLGEEPVVYGQYFSSLDVLPQASIPHAVGHAVTIWMNEQYGPTSHTRFWLGYARQNERHSGWEGVFESTFGDSSDEMVSRYNHWLRARYPLVVGTLIVPDRLEPTDLYMGLIGQTAVQPFTIDVGEDGSFSFAAPADRRYRLSVANPEWTCSTYLQVAGAGTTFQITEQGLRGVAVAVPEEFCQQLVRGTVVDQDGEALAGHQLLLCDIDCADGKTDEKGTFDLLAPGPGAYSLEISDPNGDCAKYHHSEGAVDDLQQAEAVDISGDTVVDLSVVVQQPMCGYWVRGMLLGLPASAPFKLMLGLPQNKLRIFAISDRLGRVPVATISSDGTFEIPLSGPGLYTLELEASRFPTGIPQSACYLTYPERSRSGERQLNVTKEGHEPIVWMVPPHFCRFRVIGTVVDMDDRPLADMPVRACAPTDSPGTHHCGAFGTTNHMGQYRLYVPYQGTVYMSVGKRSWVDPRACGYHEAGRFQEETMMDGADVTGVKIQVPRWSVCLEEE